MSTGNQKIVLTISNDEMLQQSRTLLLESAGYTVVPIEPKAISSFLENDSLSNLALVLLCHSITDVEKKKISMLVKQKNPTVRILSMYNLMGDTETYVDRRIQNLHSPQHLLNSIEELIGGD